MTEQAKPFLIVGKVRRVTDEPVAVWVMSPTGQVKPLYCTVGVEPWQLSFEWILDPTNQERVIGIQSIGLNPRAKRAGWRLLEDLYREEGREKDWATFLTYGSKRTLPDAYLPKLVLDTRGRQGGVSIDDDLPPPQAEENKPRKSAARESA